MMAFLAFAGIATLGLLLFVLPFVPALVEWRRTDVIQPLAIPAGHDGDVRHFAKRFRAYVASEEPRQEGETTAEYSARRVATLRAFVAPAPLVVDRGSVIPGDVYATTTVYGWDDAVYRGLLADEDVALGRRSLVTRWIHGAHNLKVGASSALLGRASADGVLRVDEETTFQWLSAPRIEFGSLGEGVPLFRDLPIISATATPRPRWVAGDLEISPDSEVLEDLIVSGSLRVGAGSVIRRSIKSHGPLYIARGVLVNGSVISHSDVVVAEDCVISGIVVAEGSIEIGPRVHVGSETRATTVSAPRISVAPGAVAHGTVWAREVGEVGAVAR